MPPVQPSPPAIIGGSDLSQAIQAAADAGDTILAIVLAGGCPYDTPPTQYLITATKADDTADTLSLQEAVQLTNSCNATEPVSINVSDALVNTSLSGDDLYILVNSGETLTLEGNAGSPTKITLFEPGSNFSIEAIDGGNITLAHLEIINAQGSLNGTAVTIKNATATLENVTIESIISNTPGAALSAENSLVSISDSTFNFNQSSLSGGAIWSKNSELSIQNSLFLGNSTRSFQVSPGGAIASVADTPNGSLDIDNSRFSKNLAQGDGGAISVSGPQTVTLSLTTLEENESFVEPPFAGLDPVASQGGAMALGNDVNATLSGSTFVKNHTYASSSTSAGGALYVGDNGGNGSLTLVSNSFHQNTANTGSGNIGEGGALYIDSASPFSANITGNTFSNNNAPYSGGAIMMHGDAGQIAMLNNTFSGNQASESGGAIETVNVPGGDIDFRFNTLVGNTVTGAGAGGLNITGANNEPVVISHSVFHNNQGGQGNLCNDNSGALQLNYSLLDVGLNSANCTFSTDNGTNLLGNRTLPLSPGLEDLGLYGGTTLVYMPAEGSPLIDAGDPNLADYPAMDQRDSERVFNAIADIGAVERGSNNDALLTIPNNASGSGGGALTAVLLAAMALLLVRRKRSH